MRADKARKLYIEAYVEFEHLIKGLAKVVINEYEFKSKSLHTIIKDIALINFQKELEIPIFEIKRQRLTRNWIVHKQKNVIAPVKVISDMEKIHDLNVEIARITKEHIINLED